jgi:hypothetical protein
MDGDDSIHNLANRIELIMGRGLVTMTTNAAGMVVLTHNMGVAPVIFLIALRNSARIAIADPTTYTATTASVYVRNISDGAIVPNNSNDFQWFGFA